MTGECDVCGHARAAHRATRYLGVFCLTADCECLLPEGSVVARQYLAAAADGERLEGEDDASV
jgi:hypothetical protein